MSCKICYHCLCAQAPSLFLAVHELLCQACQADCTPDCIGLLFHLLYRKAYTWLESSLPMVSMMGCRVGEQDGFEQAYGPDDNPDPKPEDQRLPAPHEVPGVHSKKEPVPPVRSFRHGSPDGEFIACAVTSSAVTCTRRSGFVLE